MAGADGGRAMIPEIATLLSKLSHVKRAGADQWTARCPAHDDSSNDSLSIRLTDHKILIHCFGGCAPEAVVAKCGLAMADLSVAAGPGGKKKTSSQITAVYPYLNHAGELRYQV